MHHVYIYQMDDAFCIEVYTKECSDICVLLFYYNVNT